MENQKKYWKSELELTSNNKTIENLKNNEFVDQLPTDPFLSDKNTLKQSGTNRRDFLKYLGFLVQFDHFFQKIKYFFLYH